MNTLAPESTSPNAAPDSTPLSILLAMLESIALPRNVLLCVSGSIAAYKALELASMLKKLHINVAVVMSESAKKFITPLSFEAITHSKVLHAGSESWEQGALTTPESMPESSLLPDSTAPESSALDSGLDSCLRPRAPESCNHIAYARWAQLCILAPASANSLSKLAHGIADTLVIQTLLATQAPIICAPAMNTQMLLSKQTQANLSMLKELGVQIIAPRVGLLACSTTGLGALASAEEILFGMLSVSVAEGMESIEGMSGARESSLDFGVLPESSAKSRQESRGESSERSRPLNNAARFWRGREVCITGGGASAMIDSVRAISNHSSGLQASALAIALHSLGARVTLIASAFPMPLPEAVRKVHATSNADFAHALKQIAQKQPKPPESNTPARDSRAVLFMAAALVDFAPESTPRKIKKHAINGALTLTLTKQDDVLSSLSESCFVKVGFKAEDDLESALPNAMSMLYPSDEAHEGRRGKGCEVVCLNTLESNPFGSMDNRFTLLNRQSLLDSSAIVQCESGSKLALAYTIAYFVQATLESTATSHAKP